MNHLTLALDVMGGDFGPRITMPAVQKALESNPRLTFLLFGDQQQVDPILQTFPETLQSRIQFQHTDKTIDSEVSFSVAMRQSKNSSMRLAIETVANGQADGCVSGGNTGALLGLAKLLIAPLPNIDRPALTSLIPTMNGKSTVMLDLGANVEVNQKQLLQFAEMGNIFAQTILGLVYPRLALLNIGTEESKGTQVLRDVNKILHRRYDINYRGFIESDKLMNYLADVIVCDGFSGNMALKALEGAAKNIISLHKEKEGSPLCSLVKNFFMKAFLYRYYRKLQEINPDRHNGATLLGLSKVVVKSHGGASANAFFYAIEYAIQQIEHKIPERIQQKLVSLAH